MAGKEPIDFNKVGEGGPGEDENTGGIAGSAKPADDELKYSEIPSTMKSYADALLPYYGEEVCVRLFHRRWQFREEGANEFIQKMPEVF